MSEKEVYQPLIDIMVAVLKENNKGICARFLADEVFSYLLNNDISLNQEAALELRLPQRI